jgi:hypothetical protein
MNHSWHWIALAVAIITAEGCCDPITVKRVNPLEPSKLLEGIRYSLPKPYIQITPGPDGGMDADIIFLPDPENTYVIKGSATFCSSYSLNIGLSQGLLTSVDWNVDSSVVGASAVQAAGAVGQKVIDAQVAEQTKQATTLAAAQKALADATLAVQIAQANVKIVNESNGTDAAKLSAREALSAALLTQAHAQEALDALLGRRASKPPERTAAAATSESQDKSKVDSSRITYLYGPMLYAVNERTVEGKPTVELRAALPQGLYPTVGVPPKQPTLFPKGNETVNPDKDGKASLTITPSGPIVTVVSDECLLISKAGTKKFDHVTLESSTSIKADLTSLEPGAYTLKVAFKYGDPKTPADGQDVVTFTLGRKP